MCNGLGITTPPTPTAAVFLGCCTYRCPPRSAAPAEVADRLAAVEDIDYLVLVTGTYDILVELVCEDEDQMMELLNGVIRKIPGVRSTETFMYLKLKKQTYTWGTR